MEESRVSAELAPGEVEAETTDCLCFGGVGEVGGGGTYFK